MNSLVTNNRGLRTWVRREDVDTVLDSFSLLEGFSESVDRLMVDSLKEVGFVVLDNHLFLPPNIRVSKKDNRWRVTVGNEFKFEEEVIVIPRAMWGDIRFAWDRSLKR
jgi:hypothetical protein